MIRFLSTNDSGLGNVVISLAMLAVKTILKFQTLGSEGF